MIHNAYAAPSGEEDAFEQVAELLKSHGHSVSRYSRSSQELGDSWRRRVDAFFSGIYNPFACQAISRRVGEFQPEIVLIKNLFPLISPAILPMLRKTGIPIVMQVANYRLLCPSGLFLSKGVICERCAPGREYWCVLRNCESDLIKSLGYTLRSAAARKFGWFRNNISGYICATEFLSRKLVFSGFNKERIHIIRNILADPLRNPAAPIPPLGDYVAYIGRLSPEKGILTLLRAASRCPDIPFRIAGKARKGGHLPAASGNVAFLGYQQGELLRQVFSRARMVVVPSECYETFGMTAAEAMLWGRPVVVSRIGVFNELVKDGQTGIHFGPGDEEDLVAKIQWLWSQPDLCRTIGAAGRDYALKEYAAEDAYQKLLHCFATSKQLGFPNPRKFMAGKSCKNWI